MRNRRKTVGLICLFVAGFIFRHAGPVSAVESTIRIIPRPMRVEIGEGRFLITPDTRITFEGGSGVEQVAGYLKEILERPTGYDLSLNQGRDSAKRTKHTYTIHLRLGEDPEWQDEGYRITVQRAHVLIEANRPAGLFYGVQSLRQLLPTEIFSETTVHGTSWSIPCVRIIDRPRFPWRGMMLDVSRHFFPKSYIIDLIDDLASHKLNIFHWHLVDDQGWRIEIKTYPKLTEVGAWRVDREHLHWGDREAQREGEAATYGGYYTQKDIQEIVAYARSRFVTIVPEIEMPAHVMSALAAYPELSCTGGPFTVPPGSIWPITDIYCAGKEETFTFLENVLGEVIDLFPGVYIHVGGDEATKTEWKRCADCQNRIRQEGLRDEAELQSYFIQRIGRFLSSKGKRLIGWDEIMEGGITEDAAIMSWRGWEQGVEAARSGHDVVFCPTSHCYINFYQGEVDLEPLSYRGYLPLEKVYDFDPVPDSLEIEASSHILGGQVNLWTEFVPDPDLANYMIHPRIAALAEAVWTQAGLRQWDDFAYRVDLQLERYGAGGITYARSGYQVRPSTDSDLRNRSLIVDLMTELPSSEIRYTTDGSDPDMDSREYIGSIKIDRSVTLKARSYTRDKSQGPVTIRRFIIHKATAKPVRLVHPYHETYDGGGDFALTNSLRGTKAFMDGRWQGFKKDDLVAVVDLGGIERVQKISAGFLQRQGSWIFLPVRVEFGVSSDGHTFNRIAVLENDVSPRRADTVIKEFISTFEPVQAQYIRVVAEHIGHCPDWHYAAGGEAWLFIDEIVVE